MKYVWIDGQRDFYPLQALCEVLGVSTSGYADWKSCGGPTQWLSDEQMLSLIRSVHAEFKGA
ncbi:MAG: IS3 family transposase, partial [Gammaproteobacteria bacterium]|nr:IS3 family transposase [Gammaproteobacteria bacterium]